MPLRPHLPPLSPSLTTLQQLLLLWRAHSCLRAFALATLCPEHASPRLSHAGSFRFSDLSSNTASPEWPSSSSLVKGSPPPHPWLLATTLLCSVFFTVFVHSRHFPSCSWACHSVTVSSHPWQTPCRRTPGLLSVTTASPASGKWCDFMQFW